VAIVLCVKRPGREAGHLSPTIPEVKNAWSYTSTHPYVFVRLCLIKHRDNFTLQATYCAIPEVKRMTCIAINIRETSLGI